MENHAESPGRCLDGPGTTPNKGFKEGNFFCVEEERGERRCVWSVWREGGRKELIWAGRVGPTTDGQNRTVHPLIGGRSAIIETAPSDMRTPL